MRLRDYADEELQEEIERRAAIVCPPAEVRGINWMPVIGAAHEACKDVRNEDSDMNHYVFEAVMKAVFGEDFFDVWWNPRTS